MRNGVRRIPPPSAGAPWVAGRGGAGDPESHIKTDPLPPQKKNTQKEVPKGTQKITKKQSAPNFQRFWRGAKNGAPSRAPKSKILQLFNVTTLELGRASQKETQFGTILGTGFTKKHIKSGFQNITKNQFKKTFQSGPQNGTIWGSFRDPFQSN